MAGAPRPNKDAMKLFWQIMQTPKEVRQDSQKRPSKKLLQAWARDSSTAQ